MSDTRLPFDTPDALAAQATDLVTMCLSHGDAVLARALQPVARAAWSLVADGNGMVDLHRAAFDARDALRLTCRPPGVDLFLEAVVAYAEGMHLPDDWFWDEDTETNPYLAICPQIGVDETLRLGELANLYLQVAGVLAEVTVLCRAAAATWCDALEADRAVATLERAAEGLDTCAEIAEELVMVLTMSPNTGVGPLREHMEDLRGWPDALRTQARWMTSCEPGEPTDVDGEPADDDEPADGLLAAAQRVDLWVALMLEWARGARELGIRIAPHGDIA